MKKILKHLDDILIVTGAALIVYGVSLFSVPGAFILAGVECIAGGYLIGVAGGGNVSQ